MQGELVKVCGLRTEELDQAHYFEALVTEAVGLGLLSAETVARLQREAVALLARQTKRYTRGESSSIKVEVALDLMQSMYYSVGVYLKRFAEPEQAVAALTEQPLAELYGGGLALVRAQMQESAAVYEAVRQQELAVDHWAYHDTIAELATFFATYEPEFAAQEITVSIDYPLSIDQMVLVGLDYVADYVQKLYWENVFCGYYPVSEVAALLAGYGAHSAELLVNIFELLATNALCAVLCGRSPLNLRPQVGDDAELQQRLAGASVATLREHLREAAVAVADGLGITSAFLRAYLVQTAEELATQLRVVLDGRQLDKFFLALK